MWNSYHKCRTSKVFCCKSRVTNGKFVLFTFVNWCIVIISAWNSWEFWITNSTMIFIVFYVSHVQLKYVSLNILVGNKYDRKDILCFSFLLLMNCFNMSCQIILIWISLLTNITIMNLLSLMNWFNVSFQFVFWLKELAQLLQMCGFISSWTNLMWIAKLFFCVKWVSQISHINGFFFLWTFTVLA